MDNISENILELSDFALARTASQSTLSLTSKSTASSITPDKLSQQFSMRTAMASDVLPVLK